MAKPSLLNLSRVLWGYYLGKGALALFRPDLAQEHTDFCRGCKLDSDAGHTTGQFEAFSHIFVGLIFAAVAQFDSKTCMRNAICWSKVLQVLRLVVLARLGQGALTENQFIVSIVENLAVLGVCCLTTMVWHKSGSLPVTKLGKFELYEHRTALLICALESAVLGAFAVHTILTGEPDQFRPNDAGLFGSAQAAAFHIGFGVLLFGISNSDEKSMGKTIQYIMVKKSVELYYLSVLAAPFAISAGGIQGAYGTMVYLSLSLVHLMAVCYWASPRKMVFWVASVLSFFLRALGLFYPSSTASAFYRVGDLGSSNVYALVGVGSSVLGAAFYSFAAEWNMDAFEKHFVYAYGAVLAHSLVTSEFQKPIELGIFTDVANVFLVWCLWLSYGDRVTGVLKPLIPGFLRRGLKQTVNTLSPKSSPKAAPMKSSPMGKRGRSKSAGRKSK